jgi:hypothetical protein
MNEKLGRFSQSQLHWWTLATQQMLRPQNGAALPLSEMAAFA